MIDKIMGLPTEDGKGNVYSAYHMKKDVLQLLEDDQTYETTED